MEGSRILVIDDDEAVRDAFTFALDGLGLDVATAASGEAGLAQVGKHRPDLVFLDLRMPGLDGVATLERLARAAPGVPVYIVTAFHEEFMSRLAQARELGLDFQIVSKPLGPEEIRAIARAVLEAG